MWFCINHFWANLIMQNLYFTAISLCAYSGILKLLNGGFIMFRKILCIIITITIMYSFSFNTYSATNGEPTEISGFKSHFINLGGDPFVTYQDGFYYYMVTGNGFCIARSRELGRVNSDPVSVFKLADLGFNAKELWAPELHFIDGHWYIYFTAYDGDTSGLAKNHRMYVLESVTDDVFGDYTYKGQITELESDYVGTTGYDASKYKPGHFAIDQTIANWNGKLYAIWSGWNGYENISQRIYIAEMSNPWTISSKRVEISRPEYAFETYSTAPAINEGPQVLISPDNKTFNIVYSANLFTSSHYCLGNLTLKENGNPLNASDWIKSREPLFETSKENNTYSVGHCSFTTSPDGSENYMVYHARSGENTNDYPREIRVKKFDFYDDGTPFFGNPIKPDDILDIPSGTAKIQRELFEAEDMILSADAKILDSYSTSVVSYSEDYYSGGKRVSLTDSGANAKLMYNAEKSGSYNLSILSSGSGLYLKINGETKNVKTGMNGNNINNFFHYTIPVELKFGQNEIEFGYTSSFSTGCYLDCVEISNKDDEENEYNNQYLLNQSSQKQQVLLPKINRAKQTFEEGKEYTYTKLSEFDKYWFSSQPFSNEYGDDIATFRIGGNKRILVSNSAFDNLADFESEISITPSAQHLLSDGKTTVASELSVNTGILFRIEEMRDISTNSCPFSGYRCMFLKGSDGSLKIQLHQYYFTSATNNAAASKVIATSSVGLVNIPGHTYKMKINVVGDTFSAEAFDEATPTTKISISNKSLTVTGITPVKSGRIGVFANLGTGRVTLNSLSVTPKKSYLPLFTKYVSNANDVTEKDGTISMPSAVTKLMLNKEISDFYGYAKIRITNTKGAVQAGFCFRTQSVVTASPGVSGYGIYLQRTADYATNKTVINFTKYGNNGTSDNKNLGNQSFIDTHLLSDITDTNQIVGLTFDFYVTVIENKMFVKVVRADNPSIFSEFKWELDNKYYTVNKNYPVYYEKGDIGVFSNGVAQISSLEIGIPSNKTFNYLENDEKSGYTTTEFDNLFYTNKNVAVLSAKTGYFIDEKSINQIGLKLNSYNDNVVVISSNSTDTTVLNNLFRKITIGDANVDGNIDIRDIILIKKHLSNDSIIAFSNSDFNSDGKINSIDIVSLINLLIGN